jgi:tetratricopeptide (TPR) repeat protein
MPEKTVNELPRDLRLLYTRGMEALQRDNYDYAIEMFTQVLAREPSVFEIRKTLRETQVAKCGKSGGFFKRAFSRASSSPQVAKGQMALRRNPLEAMNVAEEILNSDANSHDGHKLMAEAALAAEMPKVAIMSLEALVKAAPKDKELTYQLAEAYAMSGEKTKGENVLADLQRSFPNDQEISQKLKDLSARKTLDEGGYGALAGGGGSYRDVLRNKAEAVSLEQQNRQVKTDDSSDSLIKDWEDRLKAEPTNLKMLRNLGEVWAERKQYDKSLSYYERMTAVDGGADASLLAKIAEIKVRKFDQAIAQLDPAAEDYADKAAQLKAERDAFRVDNAKQLVDRYPTDLQLRFDLGKLYFESGKISEAQVEFQKAQANPNRRIQAITYLAKCFEKKNMFDLAARRLQEVVKDKLTFDEEKKDLVYTLGCVFDKMGKKEESIEQFKLIYETDMAYKDVAKRVEDHYSGGGS